MDESRYEDSASHETIYVLQKSGGKNGWCKNQVELNIGTNEI